MVRALAIVAVIAWFITVAAHAETFRVNSLAALAEAVREKLKPGDVVELAPGTYYLDRPTIEVLRSGTPEAPITIRGVRGDGKRPIIDASKVNVLHGIITLPPQTHDVIVEGLELCNAEGGGHEGEAFILNAATFYLQGSNLTVRDCNCHHSQNGMFATREADYVLIENCELGYNGRKPGLGAPHRTHSFYFNALHQMVKNSYFHHSTDGEHFKSRGGNNIFAFNWVDEELAYSLGVDSGNAFNTLWLGNLVMKRTYEGISQGRLLGVGDGTGVARGTLVALNNTFITVFPRDLYLFTFSSATTEVILLNNVFAGPGETFLEKNGSGAISGTGNWIADAAKGAPDSLLKTMRGTEAGFADAKALDFRPRASSPLVDAGISPEEYAKAIRIVTQHSRDGEKGKASPMWLKALEEIEKPSPAYEPIKKQPEFHPRRVSGTADVGAFESGDAN
jgi:hypothetical protein